MSKWDDVLAALLAAKAAAGDESWGGYVDVGDSQEALDDLIDDARWTVFREAGPVLPDDHSRRLVNGQPLTFKEFWEARQ